MSISGNLRTLNFTELLQWLSQGTKTGTLVVAKEETEKRVFFKTGAIISTASNNPKEYLGHFLLSHGLIDELILAKAMEMQEDSKIMLGKILVTIGAITEEDLDHMLRLKAQESLYELFVWSEGEFRFYDGELPAFPMIPLAINVTHLVLEGTQRIDDWNRMNSQIPSNQGVPVAVAALTPEHPDDRIGKRILELVDDDRSIEEIALHAHTSSYQVCRVLFSQLEKSALKIVRPRAIVPPVVQEVASEKGEVEADTLVTSGERLMAEAAYEQGLRRLRAALSLDPDSQRTQKSIDSAEKAIARKLESEGLHLDAIPHAERGFEDLTELAITPQEGFILTRVNGSYDIQTILQISPVPQLEGLLTFWRLLQAGHIRLEQRK